MSERDAGRAGARTVRHEVRDRDRVSAGAVCLRVLVLGLLAVARRGHNAAVGVGVDALLAGKVAVCAGR
jgi:hypothetical protein